MDTGFRAMVAYDWEAVDPTEMTVHVGQVVFVQSVNDRGWALALDEATQVSGWVPNDYLTPLEEEEEIIEDVPQEQPQQQAQYSQDDVTNAMAALSLSMQQPAAAPAQPQQQQSAPASSEPCAGCNGNIESSALIAKGKHFHPDCFVCTTCRKPLTAGFLERDGQYFCEDDYYRSQGNVCAHCNQVIVGAHIVGNGKPYHVDHLLCAMCNVSIGTDVLHVKDDKNICHTCYNAQFAAICDKCQLPIEYQIFSALDKNFHRECFVCTEGGHQMPDESFHVHEGQIYCPEHYRKIFAKNCHQCKKDITGQYLQVLDFYFHSECWTCNMCGQLLEQTGCAKKNDSFYCPACVIKVPTQLPPAAAPSAAAPAKPQAAAPAAQAPKPQAPASAAPAKPQAPAPAAQAPKPQAPAPAAAAPSPSNVGLRETLHKDANNGSSDLTVAEMRQRLLEVSQKALEQANKDKTEEPYPESEFYTLGQLQNPNRLPQNVDRTKRENYLTDAEFQDVFKMSKDQFKALKAWKQNELKKGAKIF
eukprot:UN01151